MIECDFIIYIGIKLTIYAFFCLIILMNSNKFMKIWFTPSHYIHNYQREFSVVTDISYYLKLVIMMIMNNYSLSSFIETNIINLPMIVIICIWWSPEAETLWICNHYCFEGIEWACSVCINIWSNRRAEINYLNITLH